MLLKGNLVAIARGKESKGHKKPCTFINSFFGKRDADGLFMETTPVDCWIPAADADKLKFGSTIEALMEVNGDIIILREFVFGGQTYMVGEDKIADLKTDGGESAKKSGK